jgi:hypothetical protein
MPVYGIRGKTHELRRRGTVVNHRWVLRLMHEDNLLFVPEVALSGPDPLWVAAIANVCPKARIRPPRRALGRL